MKKLFVSLLAFTTIFLTGCGITAKPAAPFYQVVGTISDIQPATVKGKANLVGFGLGAATGAVVGNQFGSGTGKTAMTVLTGAIGAGLGAAAQKKLTETDGIQVTIVAHNQTYQIIQAYDPSLKVGQTVRLMTNGTKGRLIK